MTLDPKGWALDGGPGVNDFDANHVRRVTAALLGAWVGIPDEGTGDAGGASGVGGYDHLIVSAPGGLNVSVSAGYAFIHGSNALGQGAYHAFNSGAATLAVATAHSTNPRIDLVIVKAEDATFDGGATWRMVFDVVAGTPAAVPVSPDVPENSIILAQVAVGAAVSSINSGNITDYRRFACAVGGIQHVQSAGFAPSGLALRPGATWWDEALGRLYRRTVIGGTQYNQIIGGSWPRVSMGFSGTQSHTTSGSYQALVVSGEVVDTDGFHSSSNSFWTVPAGEGGDYQLNAGVSFAADAVGSRALRVALASNTGATNEKSTIIAGGAAMIGTANNGFRISDQIRLEPGATVTFDVFQSSGGALVMTEFWASMHMVAHLPQLT